MRARRVGLLAVVSGVAACSLTSLDGLTGGSGTDGGFDAHGGGTDTGGGDSASADGGTGDATTIDGGGPTTGPFCASLAKQPLFCDDFDDPKTATLWSAMVGPNGGDAGIDDASSRSAPRALFSYLPPLDDGGSARLEHDGLPSTASWRVGFAIHIEAAGASLAAARIGGTGYAVRLFVGGGGTTYVDEDFNATASYAPAKYTLDSSASALLLDGAWHRVNISVNVTGTAASTVDVSVDDRPALGSGQSGAISAHHFGAPSYMWLGGSRTSTLTTAWAAHVDDVVFDGPP